MTDYYVHKFRIKKVLVRTTEAELYCLSDCHCGAGVLEFTDGSSAFETDCYPLNKFGWNRFYYRLRDKLFSSTNLNSHGSPFDQERFF
jgi:hypothetical protein